MWRNRVLQRRFRKMKAVIDFNRTYDPSILSECEIFIRHALEKMPINTVRYLVMSGESYYVANKGGE